jgi:uncharacterized cupin superfamily protein
MTIVLDASEVEWPTAVPVAEDRVLNGHPETSTKVVFTDGVTELGLWRASAGDITTIHNGYEEFVHIVEGDGELVHEDGTVIPLRAGIVVLLEDGWRGRWVVRETLVKSYATVAAG